ncbi:MAG: HAD-IA family hydrolase [Deltaproteobacteria bacterium]
MNRNITIAAVLFDFDGTLTQQGALDFSIIKKELDCPPDIPVLEYIEELSDAEKRRIAYEKLARFEKDGAARSKPNPGAEDLLAHIRSKQLPIGLITRNSLESVLSALVNFQNTHLSDFDVIITRDDPVRPKPSADGILLAAQKLGVKPAHILMVGDYLFDIQSGRSAGALTVHLDNNPTFDKTAVESDFTVQHLSEIKAILDLGIPLAQGKLPNDLLAIFLKQLRINTSRMLIHPGVGEDIAAVDISGEEILILKSDPITFATDAAGRYAVTVNANDIATAGAMPRWLITTLLLPVGSTGSAVWRLMQELQDIAGKLDILLCGGHTKRNMRTGDKLLMTKSAGVEGTSVIAREFEKALLKKGINEKLLAACKRFIDRISIVEEARIACSTGGVSAMHDVTEGGVATAVAELSIAGRHRINVDMDAIPVADQTRQLCRIFNISPLGLIGSGSLLICCHPERMETLLENIDRAGIRAACIGEIMRPGQGVTAVKNAEPVVWPQFEVDELARLFRQSG